MSENETKPVAPVSPAESEVLRSIFEKQRGLMLKYDQIEEGNGFRVPHPPYRVNDKIVQERIKNLCWRATEEFAEAMEERDFISSPQLNNWRKQWDTNESLRHFYEEIIDALHFFTEASIIAGVTPEMIGEQSGFWSSTHEQTSLVKTMQQLAALIGEVIFSMGLACNCLKNKPWKITPKETDEVKFKNEMLMAWSHFGDLLGRLNLTLTDVWYMYCAKNEVNQQRQANNY